MASDFKKLTSYFQEIGAAGVSHTGDKNYLAHAIGVYNDLKKWGCDEEMCEAGLFHSVYGTELFQRFALPLDRRGDVRALIGERAERLAYWNCAMDRATLDASVERENGPYFFMDRLTGERVDMTEAELTDLITLHLCDWLEQVERSQKWDYRRAAYRCMAERLGGIALEAYDHVFTKEPAEKAPV